MLDADGEVVTNAHVVTEGTGSSIRKAEQVYVRFQDDNQVPARIVGFDPNADVALLKIDPAGLTLRPLRLGSSRNLRVGSPVAAIGSPFGQEQSLSIGVISATDRTIESLTQFSISGAIQTDAAINHGNSGGPLVDADGRVLGINSQIRSESGDGTGVGFAVPVDLVRRSVDQLREDGRVEYPYLGSARRCCTRSSPSGSTCRCAAASSWPTWSTAGPPTARACAPAATSSASRRCRCRATPT